MTKSDPLRDQLVRFLDWKEAHVDFDGAINAAAVRAMCTS